MISLYIADVSKLPDPFECPQLMQLLPRERRHKIEKSKQVKSRKQRLGAGLLLNKVLTQYGIHSERIYLNDLGKPEVDGLHFNLSHSGHLVICAVSDKPVGCDVEEIRKAPQGVAERYFSESEKEYLNQFCGEDYDTAFFTLWTMKESYVKMTGEGMALSLGEYEIVVGDSLDMSSENIERHCCGYARVTRDEEVQDCHISEVELDGYIISVCAKDSAPVEIIWKNL